MAYFSDRNLYPGINAHLNSFLQNTDGAWRSFHSEHIVDLARTIKAALPPGYIVVSEQSLQIGAFENEEPVGRRVQTVPDVMVFQNPAAPTHAVPAPPPWSKECPQRFLRWPIPSKLRNPLPG